MYEYLALSCWARVLYNTRCFLVYYILSVSTGRPKLYSQSETSAELTDRNPDPRGLIVIRISFKKVYLETNDQTNTDIRSGSGPVLQRIYTISGRGT